MFWLTRAINLKIAAGQPKYRRIALSSLLPVKGYNVYKLAPRAALRRMV